MKRLSTASNTEYLLSTCVFSASQQLPTVIYSYIEVWALYAVDETLPVV